MTAHRCGGHLSPAVVDVSVSRGAFDLIYRVAGLICDRCGDHVITPQVMRRLETDAIAGESAEDLQMISCISPAVVYRGAGTVRSTLGDVLSVAETRPEPIGTARTPVAEEFSRTSSLR
jgi:hypothetical protein